MVFLWWGRELLPGHDFSLELGLLNEVFRTISGHLCGELANMDSYLARFINLCYYSSGGSILGFQTKTLMVTLIYLCRGVAQAGSASALGAEGRRFESVHPDHFPSPGRCPA